MSFLNFLSIKSFFKNFINKLTGQFKSNVDNKQQLLLLAQNISSNKSILNNDGRECAELFLEIINKQINTLDINEHIYQESTDKICVESIEDNKNTVTDKILNDNVENVKENIPTSAGEKDNNSNLDNKIIKLDEKLEDNKNIDTDKILNDNVKNVKENIPTDTDEKENIKDEYAPNNCFDSNNLAHENLKSDIKQDNKNIHETENNEINKDDLSSKITDLDEDKAVEKFDKDINHKKDSKINKSDVKNYQKLEQKFIIKVDPKKIEAKKNDLLAKIRHNIINDMDISALERDLYSLIRNHKECENLIKEAKIQGNNLKEEIKKFTSILNNGIFSNELIKYWECLPYYAPWFKNRALKTIISVIEKELLNINDRNEIKDFLDKAASIYGVDIYKIKIPELKIDSAKFTSIIKATDHTLYNRSPAMEWNIFIDETGTSFSSREEGVEGRIVAICIPARNNLPTLNYFHSNKSSQNEIIDKCNILLSSNCGIFGLSQGSLEIEGKNGWLKCIHELIIWVWRLIPLPKNDNSVILHYHIEERAEFTPKLETSLSEKILLAEFEHEDADRAKQVILRSLTFHNKNTPNLPWADVISYLWGNKSLRKQFAQSGLIGTSLVDCTHSLLQICENIFKKHFPDESQWIKLFENTGKNTSLQWKALKLVEEHCQKNPEYWKRYAKAMQKYLAEKKYSLPVLEKMSTWLHKMDNPGIEAEYFYHSAELARLNHMGDVDSKNLKETIAALEELTPQIHTIDPVAHLHIMLRLAVSDSNAFDFIKAEERLAPWNPMIGGKLTGSELWDGKIFSSLGQYRAFQNDPLTAIFFFKKAIEQFETLQKVDYKEGTKQLSQTRTYLAIAVMDMPSSKIEDVRKAVEEALGIEIKDAIDEIGNNPDIENPYPLYLLTRYLAFHGTDEELDFYNSLNLSWTNPNMVGHPWPQIQYFRWLITDDDNITLKDELKNSIKDVKGNDNMPTMDLIVMAIVLSMGILSQESIIVQNILSLLELKIPRSESIIRQLKVASSGDILLAKRVLPFNFC